MQESVTRSEKIEQLRAEIESLFDQQRKAMESAVFLGMTPEQVKQVDARRKTLKDLIGELIRFCG